MRAALITKDTGKVENVIELPSDYDPEAEDAYLPPSHLKIETNNADKAIIGGRLVNGVWEAPVLPVVPPPSTQATVQEQLDSLLSLLVSKGTITQAQADSAKTPKPKTP